MEEVNHDRIQVASPFFNSLLEDDPDRKQKGVSFACEKAKVIGVHKIPGKLIKKARKVLLKTRPVA